MATLEEALAEAQRNNRVCPEPKHWNSIYELLPNKRRKGGGWEPPLPPILAAWYDTPALVKILCFKQHLEWAAAHEVLEEVFAFMRFLREEDWHHLGE